MFATMVRGWREDWGQGDFPFYYCQIAPYDYDLIASPGTHWTNSAYLREQQLKAEQMIPNSGMAVLMDVGMEKGIHPQQKQVVGERLARLALAKTYGWEGITAEPPYYKGIEIQGNTIVVSFERCKMWINVPHQENSTNFEIAGEDRIFHPATAIRNGKTIVVSSEEVPHPVAVRYAFRNYAAGDLFGEDLPVSSFRSDNWEE